jgi:hypothetical protein
LFKTKYAYINGETWCTCAGTHMHAFALMELHGFPISCWFKTCYTVLCRILFQNYCHFPNRGQGLFASCPVLVQFPLWHFVSQHLLGPLSHTRLRQSNIFRYFSRLNCFIWVTQLPYCNFSMPHLFSPKFYKNPTRFWLVL